MKLRFQFSIRTLVLAVLAIAIVLACYNMTKQIRNHSKLNSRLANALAELEFRHAVDTVVNAMDVGNIDHQQAVGIISGIARCYPQESSFNPEGEVDPPTVEQVRLDGYDNRMVLIFSDYPVADPGFHLSVVVLLDNDRILDVQVHQSYSRHKCHTTSVEDANFDGQMDLVFKCRWVLSAEIYKVISFPIEQDGFGEMVETIVESGTVSPAETK